MNLDAESSTTLSSSEAEQSVLGCLLLDNLTLHQTANTNLKAEHFFYPENARIWSAAIKLIESNAPADAVTVNDALGEYADWCGGHQYLHSLAMSVASTKNIRHYAQIVVEKAQRRGLLMVASQIQALAHEPIEPTLQLDQAQALVTALQCQGARRTPPGLFGAIVARTERWSAMGRGENTPGMQTRLPKLDEALGGGLRRGRVVVLAARPGVGKTSLAIQIALNLSSGYHRVLVLSQEMPLDDVIDRIAANLGRMPLDMLASGIAPDEHTLWARVNDVTKLAATLPLNIDDQPCLSIQAIRSKAQMAKAQGGLDVLILDYLQLCAPTDSRASRHHQIEEISRGIKTLAKELAICIVVLSQINRDAAKAFREPTLVDLKESGAIEEDADVVLFLHPRAELRDGAQLLACIIGKNRHGRYDRIALRFDGAYHRWDECALDVATSKPQASNGSPHDTGL